MMAGVLRWLVLAVREAGMARAPELPAARELSANHLPRAAPAWEISRLQDVNNGAIQPENDGSTSRILVLADFRKESPL